MDVAKREEGKQMGYKCCMCRGSFEGKPAMVNIAGDYCESCHQRKSELISAHIKKKNKKRTLVTKFVDWLLKCIRY